MLSRVSDGSEAIVTNAENQSLDCLKSFPLRKLEAGRFFSVANQKSLAADAKIVPGLAAQDLYRIQGRELFRV